MLDSRCLIFMPDALVSIRHEYHLNFDKDIYLSALSIEMPPSTREIMEAPGEAEQPT
jgi:hypothetical protein